MHQLTSGVSAGSSLALVLKLLSWADNHPAPLAPVCDAIVGGDRKLDSWSFALGIVAGILLYAFVELVITFRWALIQWGSTRSCSEGYSNKPRYKILG